MASVPAGIWGVEVPPGDELVPVIGEELATLRITMAAIDPSAEPVYSGTSNEGTTPRATLKLIQRPFDLDESDSDEDDEELDALTNGTGLLDEDESSDEDEDEEDDEEANGGPSDPSKSKKARKEEAVEALKAALADDESDESSSDMDIPNGKDLNKSKKGKGLAVAGIDDMDDEDSEDLEDMEEFVICTLDTTQHYQQPLEISIPVKTNVFFKVSGTHSVFLTGNYLLLPSSGIPRSEYGIDDEDDEYDLSPDDDELDYGEESDELDDLEDPRIMEVDSEEEAPPLVTSKSKNKRPAKDLSDDEDAPGLDELMDKAVKEEKPVNGDVKLSKKQLKKLKNNAGKAVDATIEIKKEGPASDASSGKKVQFAKNLEQGPSGKAAALNGDKKSDVKEKRDGKENKNQKNEKPSDKFSEKTSDKPKAQLGVKVVQGVTIDDRKLGHGPTAKKGSRVGMRYIGKLKDGKVFDANKKGKPFSFKIGAGQVIKGWDIGVEGISVGGERRLIIPASLAYQSKDMPGIPANSELTFDIKCLEVK